MRRISTLLAVSATVLTIASVTAPAALAAGTSEIKLVKTLDDPRGFCVDMAGSKQQASTTSPLQGHTCYDYQGAIAVDQGVTTSLISSGVLRLPAFGVCVVGTGVKAGSAVTLKTCGATGTKAITMTSAGLISPIASAKLCLTIGNSSTPGGGGTPVHLKRSLTWETCSAAAADRQTWTIKS